jgi:phosphoglycolate phosphatase-like HAD superfamily hydrolase
MTRLVLFDVDATLVLTGGAGGRAMDLAFRELYGVTDGFAGIAMAGRTDPAILADALARTGRMLDDNQLGRFRSAYCGFLRREITRPGSGRRGLMPGVGALLETLAPRPDVCLALLTGNFAEGARIKLEHFNLWHYFQCGAFGDDAPDRPALVPIARARAEACGAGLLDDDHVFVIGDTPLDVACALASGVRAIGVATGGHDVAALRAAGAHVAFVDLADTTTVLSALDLNRGA